MNLGTWLVLMACSNEPEPVPEPKEEFSKSSKVDAEQMAKEIEAKAIDLSKQEYEVLAPSPEETRVAVEKAGLVTALSGLIPERDYSLEGLDADQTALRVGILLSDTILLVKELPKARLVANLKSVAKGLRQMGAGAGLCDTVDGYGDQVNNDALTRDDLLFALEQIASMSVPGEGFGKNDRTGPMLQAGAWTSGVSLVSEAIIKENRIDTADKLLRHGPTADYFLSYVQKGADNKAPTPVLEQLESSLKVLKAIAEKEKITYADVTQIQSETRTLLEMI